MTNFDTGRDLPLPRWTAADRTAIRHRTGVLRRRRGAPCTHRIEVRVAVRGATLVCEYVGPGPAVARFAEAMRAWGYVTIVDTAVREGIPPLPCRRLWLSD
jgi:hypothetical protein